MIQDGAAAKQFGDALASHDMGCTGLQGQERLACLRALPVHAVATQFNNSWMCANTGWNASYDPWSVKSSHSIAKSHPSLTVMTGATPALSGAHRLVRLEVRIIWSLLIALLSSSGMCARLVRCC